MMRTHLSALYVVVFYPLRWVELKSFSSAVKTITRTIKWVNSKPRTCVNNSLKIRKDFINEFLKREGCSNFILM